MDTSLPGTRVVRVLERLKEPHGVPAGIVIDNGNEFTSRAVEQWAWGNRVGLHFITPGKPVENASIASFNGKCRDACWNQHWFVDRADAREKFEAWRVDYNTAPPHSALGYQTPEEFAPILSGREPAVEKTLRPAGAWKSRRDSHFPTAPTTTAPRTGAVQPQPPEATLCLD